MIDLTTGPTFRNMIRFSLPIMIQGSFQIIYNLVDRYWVGNLGASAFGAVTVGFPVFFFMIAIVFGIAIGAGIIIAQYKGAGDRARINLTIRNFLAIGSIFVIIISIVFIFLADKILILLNTPEDVMVNASIYLKWIFGGMISFFWFNASAGILRGLGDSTTPTKIAAISTVINVILDPLMIYGYFGIFPRWEVAGAAIATVIANIVAAIIMTVFLIRQKDYVNLNPSGFRFDIKIIKEIFRQGLPASATMAMVSMSMMIFMGLVNKYGTYALAGYGIGITLDALLMMPAQTFGASMATIAGQNIGAGKVDRIKQYLTDTIRTAFVISIIGSIALILMAPVITKWFQPKPEDYALVFPFVLIYVRIMPIRYLSMAIFFPVNGAIRGAGDAVTSMLLVAVTQLIIRVPFAFIFVNSWGYTGIIAAIAFASIFGAILQSFYFRSNRWQRFALVKRTHDESFEEAMIE